MLNQALHTITMAIPEASQAAYEAGKVAVNNGVLRYASGPQVGQIAAHLIPVSQTAVRGALLVPVLATQFATIGAVAVAFVVINKKLNAIRDAIDNLHSKFDDKQWSLVAGAINDLYRIEEAGKKSPIWNDIGGVRQRLSGCSAYHWCRLSGHFETLDVPWKSCKNSTYPVLANEATGDLIAYSISSFAVARTLLMDGEYDLAYDEAIAAKEHIEEAVEKLAKGQLNYLLKRNRSWRHSSEHHRLVTHVEELVEMHKPIDAIYRFDAELSRDSRWFDNGLSSNIRRQWQDDGLHGDTEFWLCFSAEARIRERSYEVCKERRLSAEKYLSYVSKKLN